MHDLLAGETVTGVIQPSVTTQVQQVRTVKITLDGSWNGPYRGTCECGVVWNDVATFDGLCDIPSPTRPIAEAVLHRFIEHREQRIEILFTDRFVRWLGRYWNGLNQAGLTPSTR